MISTPTLTQAREALIVAAEQKLTLQSQVNNQARKITDLEREVQSLASNFSRTQQELIAAKQEIQSLRSQLPDEATQRAFDDLTQYLTTPAETRSQLRMAA